MELIIADVSAQKTPSHARAAAATVTQYDHVAAAAYLMKHTGTTALNVTDAQTGQPAGVITRADIAHAITDGKDLNDVRVQAVMTTRPAITPNQPLWLRAGLIGHDDRDAADEGKSRDGHTAADQRLAA